MSAPMFSARMDSVASVDDQRLSVLDDSDSGSEEDLRRVQIQAIPHSTITADALLTQGRAAPSRAADANISDGNGGDSGDDAAGSGLPYGLPSAANGLPMGQQPAGAASADIDAGRSDGGAPAAEGRKSGGLRAVLASKFAAKKKPKDLRSAVAASSQRQQHQLESLMSQSGAAGRDSSSGPMVGGRPVGHPMSFQHVEHLSPTDIAPKMPLINGRLYKPAEPPAKTPAPTERRLKFRSFKPAALLTKPSKASTTSSSS
ncbi:hypothetical protein H4R19_004108, partial [Coemansia spiralis]